MSKKEEIIGTTIDLFKREGCENATIQRICEVNKITKGTFYYHFKSKGDLIYAFFELQGNSILSIFPHIVAETDDRKKIWIAYEFWLDMMLQLGEKLLHGLFVFEYENGFDFFSPYPRIPRGNLPDPYNMIIELIKSAQASGAIRNNAPHERLIITLNAMMTTILMDWSAGGRDYDPKEEIRAGFDAILN
ncbi:MAG: TetR/AcrR family transcriptional regulator [Clostridiales Family XIII bacterium]|nr:TetR/AcrR family transcriptional regulator [Clostridiales Family XIII bacterium]